jgi:hypothetical protein
VGMQAKLFGEAEHVTNERTRKAQYHVTRIFIAFPNGARNKICLPWTKIAVGYLSIEAHLAWHCTLWLIQTINCRSGEYCHRLKRASAKIPYVVERTFAVGDVLFYKEIAAVGMTWCF